MQMKSFFFNKLIEEPFCLQNPLREGTDLENKQNNRFKRETSKMEDVLKNKNYSSYYFNAIPYPVLNYMNEYTKLFTAFHLHPCMIVNMFRWCRKEGLKDQLTKYKFEPSEFVEFVVSMLGGVHGDFRKQNLYIAILKEVLKIELEDYKDFFDLIYDKATDDVNEIQDPTGKTSNAEHLPYTKELICFIMKKDFKLNSIFELASMKIIRYVHEEMRSGRKDYKSFLFCFHMNQKLREQTSSLSDYQKKHNYEKSLEKILLLYEKIIRVGLFEKIKENYTILSTFLDAAFQTINQTMVNKFPDFKSDDDNGYFLVNMFFYPIRKVLLEEACKKSNGDAKWNFVSVSKFIEVLCLKRELIVKDTSFNNYLSRSLLKKKIEKNYREDYILKGFKNTLKTRSDHGFSEIYFKDFLDNQDNQGNIMDDSRRKDLHDKGLIDSDDEMAENESHEDKNTIAGTCTTQKSVKKNEFLTVKIDNLKLFYQQALDQSNEKITVPVRFIYKITKIICKTHEYAARNHESYLDDTSIRSISSYGDFLNSIIYKPKRKSDDDDFLSWNYTNDKYEPKNEELGKSVNFTLKNVSIVRKEARQVKTCKRCLMYVPTSFVSLSSQDIIKQYDNVEVNSLLHQFIETLHLMKDQKNCIVAHDNVPEAKIDNFLKDPKTLNLTSQRYYYEHEKDFNMKQNYNELLVRIEKLYQNFDIDPFNIHKNNESEETKAKNIQERFFKKTHKKIVTEYILEMKKRTRFYDETISIYTELNDFFFPVLKHKIKEFSNKFPNSNKLNTIEKEEKNSQHTIIPEYQSTLFNLKLGFSAWHCFDDFDKEKGFVSVIIRDVFKLPLNEKVFQNLTRYEKDCIRSSVHFSYNLLESKDALFASDINTLQSARLMIETDENDNYVCIIYCSIPGSQCEHILDKKIFTDYDILCLRKSYWLTKESERDQQTIEFRDGKVVVKRKEFLYMISIVEYNNYVYRVADYFEIKTLKIDVVEQNKEK